MKSILCYFNASAILPAGGPHAFLTQELPWLLARFDQVFVTSYAGVTEAGADGPLSPKKPGWAAPIAWFRVLRSREFWREIRQMLSDGRRSPICFLKLLLFAWRGEKLCYWTEKTLQKYGLLGKGQAVDAKFTLYSFWMSYDAYAAALLKQRRLKARFLTRGHAFDIDLARNPMNPYLMKQFIYDTADGVFLISQAARMSFLGYMKKRIDPKRAFVLAMGSAGAPIPACDCPSLPGDGVLRLISCSRVIPLKRLPMLVETLAKWRGKPICWTHIGDGEELANVRALAEEKLDRMENVIYDLPGAMNREQIEALYREKPFDLFINVSRNEGVPVAIMEAMRFGIPAAASSVGGVPELITPETGLLFDVQGDESAILDVLERFAALPEERRNAMRQAARERWNAEYRAERLLPKLFEERG